MEYIHFGMTEKQARIKYNSNASFEGPLPLCSNGNYHAEVTSDKKSVNCPNCVKLLKANPVFLKN